MTGKDYVEYIQSYFSQGKRYLEIPTSDPHRIMNRIRFHVCKHKLGWRFQILDNNLIVRVHTPYVKPVPKTKAVEVTGNACPIHGTAIIQYGYTRPGCFKCYFEAQQNHRKGIPATDAATRERTKAKYHKRKEG